MSAYKSSNGELNHLKSNQLLNPGMIIIMTRLSLETKHIKNTEITPRVPGSISTILNKIKEH